MRLDPTTVEVIRNALSYSAEEMGIALRNSSYSHNIKERMDHSCALFSPGGKLLAQAEHIPVHLGSLPWGVKNVLRYMKRSGEGWRDGDIVMANDPYIVGTHLSDVMLLKPVIVDGRVVGLSVNKAHHADVGGDTPGSLSSTATSLEQEGVVLAPEKLVRQGRLDRRLLNYFTRQVRNPEITLGDLRAQIAAVNLGERRLAELAERYGADLLLAALRETIAQAESRTRDRLRAIPRGIYTAEDCLEDLEREEEERQLNNTLGSTEFLDNLYELAGKTTSTGNFPEELPKQEYLSLYPGDVLLSGDEILRPNSDYWETVPAEATGNSR